MMHDSFSQGTRAMIKGNEYINTNFILLAYPKADKVLSLKKRWEEGPFLLEVVSVVQIVEGNGGFDAAEGGFNLPKRGKNRRQAIPTLNLAFT